MTIRSWRYAQASVIGTSHLKSGDPCQDSCACELIDGATSTEVLIAVASDGAGSAKLSQLGSTETTQFLVQRIRTLINEGLLITDLSRDLATRLVLEAQDNLRSTAQAVGATPRDLACTLVVGIVAPSAAAFFQVGDGVAIVGSRTDPINDFSWIFWPERGEYANTTAFLTDERVAEHVQHDAVPYEIDEVALLTDGIQNLVLDYKERAAHAPFFSRMMDPLRVRDDTGHIESLSSALTSYLSSPSINDRTDDDKTLILASRRSRPDE